MRILLVDDEPAILDLLASTCASDGHDVTSCVSSLDALDYLSAHKIDLLVTDLAMPSFDGLQLIREARKRAPGLLAIAITGYGSKYTFDDVVAAGATDLMFKPFRVKELNARVALAHERLRIVEKLGEQRQELQRASTDIIRGLEEELERVRLARPLSP